MNWNIAETIPETYGCRDSFNAIIAGYVHAVYTKHVEMLSNDDETRAIAIDSQSTTTSNVHVVVGIANPTVLEYARELLNGELSQNLFRITERLNEKMLTRTKTETDERNVPLEFVKIVCHIIDLNRSLNGDVQRLKSNLLRLIGVNEYSDVATFKDNAKTYVLSQVICKVCNNCRDIDLVRDVYQRKEDGLWLCPLCNTAYDNLEIEQMLLDVVNRRMLSYNLQDLQCRKCRTIKRENVNELCQCAGEYRTIVDRNDIVDLYRIFNDVSRKFHLHVLKETTDNLLSMIS